MQMVILAGGLGTRLAPVTRQLPKSMVPILGRPFLAYQLELIRRQGIDNIVLCVGHLGEAIESYSGSGAQFNVSLTYAWEQDGLRGTAGAIKNAEPLLADEFFVTYGDAYLIADYQAIVDYFHDLSGLGLMVVYKNDNQLDRSNVVLQGNRIKVYDKEKQSPGMSYINYGLSLLKKEALHLIPPGAYYSQEEFYASLIDKGQLLAYETQQRFYEIGSPQGLAEFTALVEKGDLP